MAEQRQEVRLRVMASTPAVAPHTLLGSNRLRGLWALLPTWTLR